MKTVLRRWVLARLSASHGGPQVPGMRAAHRDLPQPLAQWLRTAIP